MCGICGCVSMCVWNMWVREHVWNMWVCEHVCGICGCVSMCVEYVDV